MSARSFPERRSRKAREALLRVMEEGVGYTCSRLAARLGKAHASVEQMMRPLEADGCVRADRSGRPTKWYRTGKPLPVNFTSTCSRWDSVNHVDDTRVYGEARKVFDFTALLSVYG